MAKTFKKKQDEVRRILSRHPNWCHVPVLSLKASLDYLHYRDFSQKDLAENLILLLYPVPRIEQKLTALLEWKEDSSNRDMIHGVVPSAISKSKLLNLCLYFIEAEFHFSGDGIWTLDLDRIKQSDVMAAGVLDLPKTITKMYRYGKKDQRIEVADC